MWDLPRPGIEPVSPALAGGFLTTSPPGKPLEEVVLMQIPEIMCVICTCRADPTDVHLQPSCPWIVMKYLCECIDRYGANQSCQGLCTLWSDCDGTGCCQRALVPWYVLRVLGRKRGTCTWGPARSSSLLDYRAGFCHCSLEWVLSFLSQSEVHLPRHFRDVCELLSPL